MLNNEIKTYDSDQSCLVKFQMTFSHERKCRILHEQLSRFYQFRLK